MKNFARFLLIPAALAVGAHAAPFLAVSDDAEVFLTGTVGVRYDSNIFLDANPVSDTIFDVDPGIQYVFGNKSPTKGSFSFTDNIASYTGNTGLNSNLIDTSLNLFYDGGKSKANFNAGYQELNQNTVDVHNGDALIRRNITSVGGGGEISATDKSSVALGVAYQKTEFRLAGFSSSDVVTIPLNYYYEISPKLDASAGYRFRSSFETVGADSYDSFYNVGLRGEITPKLTGTINVGITERSFRGKIARLLGLQNQSLLGVDSSLTYAATPKVNLTFGVTNDFDTNAQGQQIKNLSLSVGGSFNVSDELSVTAQVAYRGIQYYGITDVVENRTDHYWEGQFGTTYKFSSLIGVTAAVSLRDNESDLTAFGFKGIVVSVAANFRY